MLRPHARSAITARRECCPSSGASISTGSATRSRVQRAVARHLGIRHKLVLVTLVVVVVVSFAFTALHLLLSRAWVEDDLKKRALAFAREIAATISDRREFESGTALRRQIEQIMAVRQNVLQLDILAFTSGATAIVATSDPTRRLPFA